MTAKVYFPAWCEPPQIIHMAVSYNKSCFGKIVFQCDIHHCFFRKPSVQNTDSCLVPPKYPVVVGLEELTGEPFILLEEGYAIMTMVEAVLGISILAELVLRRTNYNIVYIPIDPPVYRTIGVAYKDKNSLPIAVKYFIEYLTANRERPP